MQMTPSTKIMTAGQIDKAVANYRAMLEKHSGEFDSQVVQIILGQSGFAEEQFQFFRKRVDTISSCITRKVKVNRTRTPQQALDATNRSQYTVQEVVDEMPTGEGKEVKVYLIPFKKTLTSDQLEEEVDKANFQLVDPITLCALNEADPGLANIVSNATQWRDKNGRTCSVCFNRWCNEPKVSVFLRDNDYWPDHWFFGCVRKKKK